MASKCFTGKCRQGSEPLSRRLAARRERQVGTAALYRAHPSVHQRVCVPRFRRRHCGNAEAKRHVGEYDRRLLHENPSRHAPRIGFVPPGRCRVGSGQGDDRNLDGAGDGDGAVAGEDNDVSIVY